ncbi:exported hypothetical protein [Cupriavidus taiwanensis]|nr:exported hypothetical protein [Cupriavidus taiwanensis]
MTATALAVTVAVSAIVRVHDAAVKHCADNRVRS